MYLFFKFNMRYLLYEKKLFIILKFVKFDFFVKSLKIDIKEKF